jgi:DNA-binding FadR family transcriptional regulator
MRRGPGGGLVVAKPDPTASIEAMAMYLDYQRTEIDHLRALRERVEIGCVDYVAARTADPEVAHRLRLAGGEETGGHLMELPHRLHTEIAELSGNPVLALFFRVLTTLWARSPVPSSQSTDPDTEATSDNVEASHRGVVEALLTGDAGLARHRMRRHLEAQPQWWQ